MTSPLSENSVQNWVESVSQLDLTPRAGVITHGARHMSDTSQRILQRCHYFPFYLNLPLKVFLLPNEVTGVYLWYWDWLRLEMDLERFPCSLSPPRTLSRSQLSNLKIALQRWVISQRMRSTFWQGRTSSSMSLLKRERFFSTGLTCSRVFILHF